MRHIVRSCILLFLLHFSVDAITPEEAADPVACARATFARSAGPNWYTVSLVIRNECNVNLDFTDTLITFDNGNNLNTSFWGNFAPLSYPDSNLQITSTTNPTGGYRASLAFHLPETSWSNRILKPSEAFTLFYGTSQPTYVANSVKVFVRADGTPLPSRGSITLKNLSTKPTTITQSFAVVNIMQNNQSVATAQIPWASEITLTDFAPNTYSLVPVNLDDMQANKFVGTATPPTVTVTANQTVSSNISFSKIPYDGRIVVVTPTLPLELAGYNNPISLTLTRQENGTSQTKMILWNGSNTITNLSANSVYQLSSPSIVYNGKTCTPSISPNSITARASTPPSATVSYVCGAPNNGTSKRVMAYAPGWKTPPSAASIAEAGYTHILVAFAVFSTTNPGQLVNAFDTITRDYITSLRQAGIKVILSIGGASTSIPNTTVDFHHAVSLASSPSAFQTAFVNSVLSFVSTYGFDGIDIDIEHGLVGTGSFTAPTGDIAVLANSINTLHQQRPQLLITLAPQVANISATSGFDGTWGNYASLIMQTASALDYVGIQIYNTGCAYGIDHVCYADEPTNPDLSVAMATALLENWPQQDNSGRPTGFQPYRSFLEGKQVVLGYPAPNRQGMSDGQPVKSTAVIKRALKCLRTAQRGPDSCNTYVPPRAYPNIGGVFEWEITYDQDNDFRFARDLSGF